jgi:hypothetical protein
VTALPRVARAQGSNSAGSSCRAGASPRIEPSSRASARRRPHRRSVAAIRREGTRPSRRATRGSFRQLGAGDARKRFRGNGPDRLLLRCRTSRSAVSPCRCWASARARRACVRARVHAVGENVPQAVAPPRRVSDRLRGDDAGPYLLVPHTRTRLLPLVKRRLSYGPVLSPCERQRYGWPAARSHRREQDGTSPSQRGTAPSCLRRCRHSPPST